MSMTIKITPKSDQKIFFSTSSVKYEFITGNIYANITTLHENYYFYRLNYICIMKREITNTVRYLIDNWLPPVIRDNKFFMYPVFYYWFKGKNIDKIMNFKKDVFYM